MRVYNSVALAVVLFSFEWWPTGTLTLETSSNLVPTTSWHGPSWERDPESNRLRWLMGPTEAPASIPRCEFLVYLSLARGVNREGGLLNTLSGLQDKSVLALSNQNKSTQPSCPGTNHTILTLLISHLKWDYSL